MVVPFQSSYYIIYKYMYCVYLVPSFSSLWNSGTGLKTLLLSLSQFEGWDEIRILSNGNVKNLKDTENKTIITLLLIVP